MFSSRMIIGLSVGLGLMLIELIGFIGGISMFMPFQSMLCILMKKSDLYVICAQAIISRYSMKEVNIHITVPTEKC